MFDIVSQVRELHAGEARFVKPSLGTASSIRIRTDMSAIIR